MREAPWSYDWFWSAQCVIRRRRQAPFPYTDAYKEQVKPPHSMALRAEIFIAWV